jgi:hypothetical protein
VLGGQVDDGQRVDGTFSVQEREKLETEEIRRDAGQSRGLHGGFYLHLEEDLYETHCASS